MSQVSVRPLWRGRTLAVIGIVLFAFSLRSAVASLSPLLDHIEADFELSAVVVGLIGTVPPACYAVFGILTPMMERRYGLERLAVIAMTGVALGLFARGFAFDSISLLAATALVFAGVGVGNILLLPLVKKYFPDRIGLMMTVYSTTMAVSTFIPPLVAVPLADAAGWRLALGVWAVSAVLAMIPWAVMFLRERAAAPLDVDEANARVLGRMWRLPLPWALTIVFASSGSLAYSAFGWLPVVLVDAAGVTPAEAGVMLSLFALIALPIALLVPVLVVRYEAVRLLVWIGAVAGATGLGGLILFPTVATLLWVLLYGMTATLFPLSLVLLGLRARTHEGAVALSGFVQSVGYGVVALFPLGLGLLHDLTKSWVAPLLVLVVVALVAIPAGMVTARPHTVEDEWERRHGAWNGA